MGLELNVIETQLVELNQLMNTLATLRYASAPVRHGHIEDVGTDFEVWQCAMRFWSIYSNLPKETAEMLEELLNGYGGDDNHPLSHVLTTGDWFDDYVKDVKMMMSLLSDLNAEQTKFNLNL